MTNTGTDITITKQGEISVFAYRPNDLGDTLEFLGFGAVGALSQGLGAPAPIYANNPAKANDALIIDVTDPPPELGTLAFTERLFRTGYTFLEKTKRLNCPIVLYVKIDNCGRPDDPDSWQAVWIVESVKLNNLDTDDLMSIDSEGNVVNVTGEFSVIRNDRAFPILFAEKADDTVLAEILDIDICGVKSCGACGSETAGCENIYALATANTGSPGLSAQVVASTDSGVTWTTNDITTLAGNTANEIMCIGNYIVVVSDATNSHHYANRDSLSGGWLEVTTGYVVGNNPTCVAAAGPTNVVIGAQNGYIYRASDFKSSVTVVSDGSASSEDVNDIMIRGSVGVAVGDNNAVQYSINGGFTWSALTGPAAGDALLSVWVVDDYRWWVGTDDGELWYTQDQGVTWAQKALPNQSDVTAINSISFSGDSPTVGALAVDTGASSGTVLRTITSGLTWIVNGENGIKGLPSNGGMNAVVACDYNFIAAGGVQSGSSDGLLAIATIAALA